MYAEDAVVCYGYLAAVSQIYTNYNIDFLLCCGYWVCFVSRMPESFSTVDVVVSCGFYGDESKVMKSLKLTSYFLWLSR